MSAAKIDCAPFDAARFREVLAEIRDLTMWDDVGAAAGRLFELCASAGVAVVFVGEIGKTRASGAARWLTPTKALIQLSLRHKSDDHLWFSLFHEAAHILLHSKKETFINTGSAPHDRQTGLNGGLPSDRVRDVDPVVLAVDAGDAEKDRRPSSEAELSFLS
jgi:hypothetical protein